jgi:ribosomal protein S18 acetylase RimI-like enzyme
MQVRDATSDDRERIRTAIAKVWGMPVVTPVAQYAEPEALDAFVAEHGGQVVGAVTWAPDDSAWEVVTLEAFRPRIGIGGALMTALRRKAEAAGATRIWLITTDDNPDAIAFYRAIGMQQVGVHHDFSSHVRRFKPDATGAYDAFEFEWRLVASG